MSCERVKASLLGFLQEHLPKIKADDIDDIIISYVESVLEDLESESDLDVEALVETLSAYVPQSQDVIPEEAITSWIFQLAKELRNKETKEARNGIDLKAVILETTTRGGPGTNGMMPSSGGRSHKISEGSSSCGSLDYDCQKPGPKRINRLSETSDGGSEGSLEGEDFGPSMALLAEMFPDSCSLELNQCLQLTGGDVAKTAEMVIHRHETGQSLKPSDRKIKMNKVKLTDEKEVKKAILGKYGYVDKEEDGRYHRPMVKKLEEKKMIRYRDGKIVSTKGERFTQVSKAESEEMKKSIVNILSSNIH